MTPIAFVVDDSMLIRHTVCRYLEELGCRVESATNGEEALEMLRDLHPHIIITDLQMPKMDGYQLIQALKNAPETSSIPIVILAAATSRAEKFLEARADFVVFKDIDIENQLRQVLQKALLLSDGPPQNSPQG
ncbi:MAG TPA: response regulator [Candidatus Angelobacter sp.]